MFVEIISVFVHLWHAHQPSERCEEYAVHPNQYKRPIITTHYTYLDSLTIVSVGRGWLCIKAPG